MSYDPNPRYRLTGGEVELGFGALADAIVRERPGTLAIDGPAALPWDTFVADLRDEIAERDVTVEVVDARHSLAPWEEIQQRTQASLLPRDPVFGRVFEGSLADLFDEALWSPTRFGPSPEAPWPVTSASKSSPAFDPRRYWRGPVWVNVNWFFIQGLERYGLQTEADELRRLTLELVSRSGFVEYYDPRSGGPLGVSDFSWSAALTLDLLLRP